MEKISVEKNLLFKHPMTMLVAGSTGSGKTFWVRKFLENFDKIANSEKPVLNVTWAYGVHQDLYNTSLANPNVRVTYNPGFPESIDGCDVLVLDDLQNQAGDDRRLSDLFCRYSHHRKLTVIFIVQAHILS